MLRPIYIAILLPILLGGCTGDAVQSGATAGCTAPATLIINASIVDGTGAAPQQGAVRLCGDRIDAMGQLDAADGETVIDAQGLVLSPGFIDTHSHHDDKLFEQPEVIEAVSQGITTIVVGQDGTSRLPLAPFFTQLEAAPAAVNVASYSGHNTIRAAVLGEDFKRVATEEEVTSMSALLQKDMDAGALGLATGLEYDPGIYSAREEVVTLARVAARSGGRYISHMRSEDRNVWEAVDELINIGREAGIPVQISHVKLAMLDWWGQSSRLIAMLDKARASGVDVTADIYPYTYWQSTLRVLWPERDFYNRDTADYIFKHVAAPDGILIAGYSADPSLVGKTVAQIAEQRAVDPVTTVIDLLRRADETDGSVGVIGTSMSEQDVAQLMAWPHANISSDGGVEDRHPRGAGTFPRVLGRYVREQGLLSLPAAIHKMTGLSAQHMGFRDRGVIRPGAMADLVLFDPATIIDRATTKEPGLLSVGIAKVWVNGETVFQDGKPTGRRPGRVVRRVSAVD